MMCYYKDEYDGEAVPVKHSITGVNNDYKHNNAVRMFEEKALEKVPITVQQLTEFSDGAAC